MAREIKDVNKSMIGACNKCSLKDCCPYEDRDDCLDARSDLSNMMREEPLESVNRLKEDENETIL